MECFGRCPFPQRLICFPTLVRLVEIPLVVVAGPGIGTSELCYSGHLRTKVTCGFSDLSNFQ